MAKTDYKVLKQIIYGEIEREVAKKKKAETTKNVPFDINIFNRGMEWYNSGLSLDDAAESYKKNIHFINGYERAKRLARLEENKKNSDKHR